MTKRFTTDEELRHRAAYHPPKTSETVQSHERVRAMITDLTVELNALLPEGREKSMALSFADQTMWAANAAIARHFGSEGGTTADNYKPRPVSDSPQA